MRSADDLVHGLHRVGQGQARGSPQASSSIMASTRAVVPTFKKVATSAQVGVADDDVQPAVALRVGVGLVAGVDDGPLERRLEADLLLEELGPLRELEVDVSRVERPAVSVPTLPGPGEDLAGHEVRRDAGARSGRRGRPGPSGSSRGSRRSCPCRRSCSCRRRVGGRSGRRSVGRHHRAAQDLLAGLVVDAGTRGRRGTRGSRTRGGRGRRRSGPRW